jgi:ABC-type nitrate/sulfonate/bicarbonate transport system substrate-binding protein
MIDGSKAKLSPTVRLLVFLILFIAVPLSRGFCATTSMRFLYPSFSGTWATPWIAKEAGYFAAEGLDVELVRVGGALESWPPCWAAARRSFPPAAARRSRHPPREAMS